MSAHEQVPVNADPLLESFIAHVLADLVRIPSTNPSAYEGDVSRRIASWFDGTPVETELVESMPDRPSVGAILRGGADGTRLILNGHMDT